MSRVANRFSTPPGPRPGAPSPGAPPRGRLSRGGRGLLALALLSLTAGLVGGCGGGESLPPLHPVKGKVTLNKQAYTGGGTVTFHPTDPKKLPRGVPAPIGQIDEHGNYELKTSGQEGAPEGSYKVTVAPGSFMKGAPGQNKKLEMPFRQDYGDARKSPVLIVVPNRNPGAYDIPLKK